MESQEKFTYGVQKLEIKSNKSTDMNKPYHSAPKHPLLIESSKETLSSLPPETSSNLSIGLHVTANTSSVSKISRPAMMIIVKSQE
jgi:hypothetical protein